MEKNGLENHYDKEYFEWQRTVGEFGGKANLFKFSSFIKNTDTVLDFGCGGGYLLKNIDTSGKKIGVEINENAYKTAIENGVEIHKSLSEIESNSVDVIISNHALEHIENPLHILYEFKRIIKSNGKIVVVVPHECGTKVNRLDNNMHLYTWSPQTLVNLFRVADISVLKYNSIYHLWMPHYQTIQKIFGWKIFNMLCTVYGRLKGTIKQTIVVGSVLKK